MATLTVNAVHKELSVNRTHRHIDAVFTTAGQIYTRAQVVASLRLGNTWQTSHGGYSAKIHEVDRCPKSGCTAAPYIETNPDSSLGDNLENLPERQF